MNSVESDFLNAAVNSCYENGMAAMKNGEYEKARCFFYAAAENTLKMARGTSGQARARLIERADELCSLSDRVAIGTGRRADKERGDEPRTSDADEQDQSGEARAVLSSLPTKDLTLDSVKGLESVKEEISRMVIYPQKYSELYERFRKKKGGGVLLYGVPGTGKTMIANAIANELGAVFYVVKCSDILSKWFGEAEQRVKELFDEARKNPLSVIFFDEFDALGASRDTDSSAMKRIIPELLVNIQNASEGEGTVLILAATNRPWDIDSAFLRPGRFNRSIHVPLPDRESRLAMIESELSEVPTSDELSLELIADMSEGFSGADVMEVCERLKDSAIGRIIRGEGEEIITNEDARGVLERLYSSVRRDDLERIEEYRRNK